MTDHRVYFDHAATTWLSEPAMSAMLPWLRSSVAANPSSVHRRGQAARAAIELARERVAEAIGGVAAEVVFTSGATEADALAIHGALAGVPIDRPLLVSPTEHAAVLRAAEAESRRGRAVYSIPVDGDGVVTPTSLEATVDRCVSAGTSAPALVTVMHTNNETGAVTDVVSLAAIARRCGAMFHCDAVQSLGYAGVDVRAWGVDLAVVSSHKIGGPQGAGALWVRDGIVIEPQLLGGSQERGRRAGTHAVASIIGFGAAAADAARDWEARACQAGAVRDRLEAGVATIAGTDVRGGAGRGPKHLNVHVAGVDGEALLYALDAAGLEVSAGSACAAGSLEPSHVLMAMGKSEEEARATVRFSVSHLSTAQEADRALDIFREVVERLRSFEDRSIAPGVL